jgi:hypothetical protein
VKEGGRRKNQRGNNVRNTHPDRTGERRSQSPVAEQGKEMDSSQKHPEGNAALKAP